MTFGTGGLDVGRWRPGAWHVGIGGFAFGVPLERPQVPAGECVGSLEVSSKVLGITEPV